MIGTFITPTMDKIAAALAPPTPGAVAHLRQHNKTWQALLQNMVELQQSVPTRYTKASGHFSRYVAAKLES